MMATETGTYLVTAAAAGDPAALERLVSDYLPLVYNIVGRALPVPADVDDVVQETMLRVVRGLPTLRDVEAFRSWLVAVAMNQVRDHARGYPGRPRPLEEALEVADPGADFADLTLTELGLTGQRREVAMATAWLDPDDRELLSLWWLVEAGHITRGELVTAIGLDPHHVTVRIARMKAQLEISRAVVRALCAVPICLELSELAMHWHGRPEALWRKRFARHTRQCPTCAGLTVDFVPAERLLVRLPLIPVPFGLADAVHYSVAGSFHAGAGASAAQTAVFPPTATSHQPLPAYDLQPAPGRPAEPHSHRRIPRSATKAAASHLAAKAAVAIAATAAVVGAVVVATGIADNPKNDAQALGATENNSSSASTSASASDTSTPAPSSASSAASSAASSTTSKSSTSPSVRPDTSKSSTGSKPSAAATTAHNPPPPPSSSAASTAPTTPPASSAGQASPVDQVLATINQARAEQGLPPLTLTAGLNKSAAAHTSVMASGCGLSHQCPGEAGLGDRETAAGVSWSAAGENIGEGGPVSNTNDAIAKMAVGLTNSMLAEKPPNDGHRRNILSTSFHHIGISIFRDSSGTVWMTQDFSD
ncbi:sigma-70 family RNA polymerase sigma factor [Catenulispora subtropica]|uniref:RNA polymerase, sigma-24 subunit, ECF subfamily n=1 Tax=Catenulispora subtropica TaxID=450798 RepID=A0ABN2T9E4_9ACTN